MLMVAHATFPGMPLPKGKSLTPEQNERVRAAVRALMQKADCTITDMARQLGITQAGLSSFLNSRTGAGPQLIQAVAKLSQVTMDELIQGRNDPGMVRPVFSQMKGWQEAEAEARRRWGHVLTDTAFRAAGETSALHPPDTITADFVFSLAQFWAKFSPPPAVDDPPGPERVYPHRNK